VTPRTNAGRKLRLIIVVLLSLEAGLVLLVLPWSVLWDRNWWVFGSALFRPFLMNNFFRGAVSGLGLITLWLGLSLAADLLISEPDEDAPPAS
jgi:hypothetical protein